MLSLNYGKRLLLVKEKQELYLNAAIAETAEQTVKG